MLFFKTFVLVLFLLNGFAQCIQEGTPLPTTTEIQQWVKEISEDISKERYTAPSNTAQKTPKLSKRKINLKNYKQLFANLQKEIGTDFPEGVEYNVYLMDDLDDETNLYLAGLTLTPDGPSLPVYKDLLQSTCDYCLEFVEFWFFVVFVIFLWRSIFRRLLKRYKSSQLIYCDWFNVDH